MPNAAEFLQLVKKAAVDAVEATKPVKIYFGRVVQMKLREKAPAELLEEVSADFAEVTGCGCIFAG